MGRRIHMLTCSSHLLSNVLVTVPVYWPWHFMQESSGVVISVSRNVDLVPCGLASTLRNRRIFCSCGCFVSSTRAEVSHQIQSASLSSVSLGRISCSSLNAHLMITGFVLLAYIGYEQLYFPLSGKDESLKREAKIGKSKAYHSAFCWQNHLSTFSCQRWP